MSKRFTLTMLLLGCIVYNGISQSITNYAFTAAGSSFTVLSGAASPALSSGTADEGWYNNLPLGFDFFYMGVKYTTISASTNGWIVPGVSITAAVPGNNLTAGVTQRPVIAPLWDDLNMQAATNVTYKTTGTSGSKIFTIQYLNAKWQNGAAGNTISFQVNLDEGTGKIEFIYRPEAGTPLTPSASIGITASATGAGKYLSLDGTGTSPAVSSVTETSSLSTAPATGQKYSFASPVPTAPSGLVFSNITTSSMTLSWTDNSSNETGFVLYGSADGGATYSYAGQTTAGVTSFSQAGLIPSTNYLCRVYAITEGAFSTALTGTQTTGSIKTFSGTGSFSNPSHWTGGTIPAASDDIIIDGACTVDNNISTDNVAYGSLKIGSATGRTLNWSPGGTNHLNVASIIAGTAANTIDMTNGGTLAIHGAWSSTNLSFIPGAGTVEVRASVTLPAAYNSYQNLVINGAAILVKTGAFTTIGNVTLTAGTLNANNFNISVTGNWLNNASTTSFTGGTGTASFSGTGAQTISGTFVTTFSNIDITNSAGTVSLGINANITGNLSVSAGIFDLGIFTANRSAAGGILTVANNAVLKIGGTNTYPSNYTTSTLVVAGTVMYNGSNQIIANKLYGNLSLSSSSGAVVKTFPATAMTVVGNLDVAIGSGSSVSFTALAAINVNGNISLGASTVFNGASYTHTIAGNWINNGTFTGSSSTIVLSGPGAAISGAGIQGFNNLTASASFVSLPNNAISLSGNLATISSGSLTQSAGGILTMAGAGKTISGSGISLENLTISGSVSTAASFILTGNLSVTGSFSATAGTVSMSGVAKTISGAGTKTFFILSAGGSITTAVNFTISSGLAVTGTLSATAGAASFTGTSSLSGTANLFNIIINGTSLQLSSGSVLGIANTMTVTAGILNVTSSIPNTVNFNGATAQNINAITYGILTLSNGNTKTAAGAITTNDDITIGSGTSFNPSSYTISVYGDWINNGTFIPATSTVQFQGPATAYLTGATTFNILTSNTSSASTELILNNNVSAATVNMVNGIISTGSNTIIITNTRTGNGFIYGNIQRTHAFTTGTAYAFEGPDNSINFSAVSGVTSITVSVVKGVINDFPYGNSISRLYTINVPSGTYTATVRMHYEDVELNGNTESSMGLWNYDGTQWLPIGKTANSTTANYVEQSGLTNINNRWTCSINPSVVLWNGSVSTDWNTAANWTVYVGSGSTPPSSSDVVVLGGPAYTYAPTISSAVSVKNLVFGSVPVALTMASGGSLTSGDIQGVWSGNATHTINVNNQTVTVNGDISLSDGTTGHAINLNIGTGTLNAGGSLTESGLANITFTGAGNLNILKDFNYVNGSFTPGAGTVTYNGTHNQAIGGVNYNHLTINNAAALVAINNALTVNGNLSLSAGELDNFASTTVAGNVNISSGAAIHNQNMLHVGGNWNNYGNFIGTGAFIFFNGTGTQTITATTFNNLIIDKPVGSKAELTGNVVINGDLTLTSGTFNIKTFDCNRSVQGGTLTLGDSATFIVSANNSPLNFSNGTLATSSTVIADGVVPQLIFGVDFGNLILRNGGLKTLVSPINVKGNLTIESGASFDGGTETISLAGNMVTNGTFTPSASTVILTGTTKTISGNTVFNRLSVYGSYTFLNNNTINTLLVINPSGSLSGGSTITTTMNGDLLNKGILYTLGTTTFTGNILQTLSLIDAVQTVAITVNFNGTVSPVLHSTSPPQYGYLNINNTGGIDASVGYTIAYGLTVGSGAAFNGGLSSHTIAGPVTNNGSITSSGTLTFIPSSAATINLGNNFSSTGRVYFAGTGALTLAGNPGTFKNVNINNSNAAGITASSDWNITKDLTIVSGSVFNAGNHTFSIGGSIINNGTINSGTSLFIMNGASDQNISSASAFNNLTINKSAGQTTLSSNITVNGILNFISGTVKTIDDAVMQPSTVTGASQLTGWVSGHLKKTIGTGAALQLFETGDDSVYTPVSLAFNNVSTAGNLTITAVPGDHPLISGSAVNPSESVNRYWSFKNEGIAFTTYNAVLHYPVTDLDAGANSTLFGAGIYAASTWSVPVSGLTTDTSSALTGVAVIGDIVTGEVCYKGTSISYTGSPYCSNAGTASVLLTGATGGIFSSDAGLSINASTGDVNLGSSSLGSHTITYTISATGICHLFTTSTIINIGVSGLWTGAVSSNWNDAANWSCAGVPNASTNVTIPAGLSVYPALTTTAAVNDISIVAGAQVNVSGGTLQINGNISNAGIFNASAGAVEMKGASAQTIPANAFQNDAVKDLIISNTSIAGVSLGGKVDVYGSLTYSGTGMKLSTNDVLTFKSTASYTAWIGNTTGNSITGKVTVERYLPARKAWNLLSVPTNTTQTIKQAWQEAAAGTGSNPVAGFGTQITDNTGTWAADGFDFYSAGGPSMKKYNSATGMYTGVPNTGTVSIKSAEGYMLYVRGDRTANTAYSAPTETILRSKGDLYTGDQLPVNIGANKFASIGNPYAAPVDMRNINTTGLKEFFYVWDPALAGSSGMGGIQTFSYNGSNYIITPGAGSYAAGGSINNFIRSGQAFFVQADVAGGSLTFKETAKTTGSARLSSFTSTGMPALRGTLYGVNTDSSTYTSDGIFINFDNSYSNTVDGKDAIKSPNTSENFSVKNGAALLVIERRNMLTVQDTIFLNLTNTKFQQYRFEFLTEQLDQFALAGFLEDTYLHTNTALNMNGSTLLHFNIANLAGSNAASRFRIIFKPAAVLQVGLIANAYRSGKNIRVDWQTENESNLLQHTVERSADGNNYSTVYTIAANNTFQNNYAWVDLHPFKNENYYRIKTTDLAGTDKYSRVMKLVTDAPETISVFPNPITDGIIHLQLNEPAGMYSVRLVNSTGQIMFTAVLKHRGLQAAESIKPDQPIPAGVYRLEIIKPDGKKTVVSLSIL